MQAQSFRAEGSAPHADGEDADGARGVEETRASWHGIIVFSCLALVLAWLVAVPLWLMTAGFPVFGDRTGLPDPAVALALGQSTQVLVAVSVVPSVMMFTPLVAAWVTMRWVHGIRFRQMMRVVGVVPQRPPGGFPGVAGGRRRRTAGQIVLACLLGIFGTYVLVVASVAVAWLCGWLTVDLTFPLLAPAAAQTPGMTAGMLFAIQLLQIPFAAVVPNGIVALGEELGWRGYLLPALTTRVGVVWAIIASGLLWGLWHAPLVLLGYNFERPGASGLALMMAACLLSGVWISWLRIGTGSLWPAVLAHGALNASAGLYVAAGTAVPADGALAGPLGAAGWIVFGAFALSWTAVALIRGRGRRGTGRENSGTAG